MDGCRRAFDFTQLFEECFMSIVPSLLLLVVASFRAALLPRARRKVVGGSSSRILKLVGDCNPAH